MDRNMTNVIFFFLKGIVQGKKFGYILHITGIDQIGSVYLEE